MALLLFGIASCDPAPVLPGHLAGLERSRLLDGEEAKALVDRLHGRGVTPVRNVVAMYAGEGGEATLYYSEYAGTAEATDVGARMAARMRTGEFPFTPPREAARGGVNVYVCYGLGQQHYFFAAGSGLYWLAVDPQLASPALDELIRVATR